MPRSPRRLPVLLRPHLHFRLPALHAFRHVNASSRALSVPRPPRRRRPIRVERGGRLISFWICQWTHISTPHCVRGTPGDSPRPRRAPARGRQGKGPTSPGDARGKHTISPPRYKVSTPAPLRPGLLFSLPSLRCAMAAQSLAGLAGPAERAAAAATAEPSSTLRGHDGDGLSSAAPPRPQPAPPRPARPGYWRVKCWLYSRRIFR